MEQQECKLTIYATLKDCLTLKEQIHSSSYRANICKPVDSQREHYQVDDISHIVRSYTSTFVNNNNKGISPNYLGSTT